MSWNWPNFLLILPTSLKKQSNVQLLIYSNVDNDAADFEACGFNNNNNKNIETSWERKLFFLEIKK